MLLVICSAVHAQAPAGLPDFEVEKHCRRQAATLGGGNFWLKACLDQEQDAYDQLKKDWPAHSAATLRRCRSQTAMLGQSYFWLNICLQQEAEATEAVRDYKFRK